MTDGDRALAGRRRPRSAPLGVPVLADDPEDFTPVGDILPAVGPEQQTLLAIVWRHTANMELRLRQAIQSTDANAVRSEVSAVADDLAQHRTACTAAITDIRGERGDNGKIGEVRRRLDALTARAWAVLLLFLGGLAAAAREVVLITTAFNAVADRSIHSAEQIRVLQAQVQTIQSALLVRDLVPRKDTDP